MFQETQFFSQHQPKTTFQYEPHHLVDEPTDSFDEGPVQEPEFYPKEKRKEKEKYQGWKDKEEKALTQAWLDVSEDLTTGDDKNLTTFKL